MKPISSLAFRVFGILLLSTGLYMLGLEMESISRTGPVSRGNAVWPYLICAGLQDAVDPDNRIRWIRATTRIVGVLGSLAWWWKWG